MPTEAECRQQCREEFPDDAAARQNCIQDCIGGQPETRVLACVDGKCKERKPSKVTQEQISACAGKTKGEPCGGGMSELEQCKYQCRQQYGRGGTEPDEAQLQECLQRCRGGPPDTVLACRGGTCKETAKAIATEAQIALCVGKKSGDSCEGGDDNGNGDEDCPKGVWYTAFSPNDCGPKYTFVKKRGHGWEGWEEGAAGRCMCTKKCQEWGCDENCLNCGGGGDGDGEQWEPSEDLQAIIQSLLARINELLGYDTGLSEEELQMIVNRMTGNIKAGERGRIESMEDRMGGMGILGTGMELEEYGKIGRQGREVMADVEAQVAIDQALRKYEQFMGTTGMAQSLFGTALGTEKMEEILNAARRGEGRQDMGLMLQYLSMLMGGNQQNPYWQAIINQMMNSGDSGGGGMDWMYWLPFLLG